MVNGRSVRVAGLPWIACALALALAGMETTAAELQTPQYPHRIEMVAESGEVVAFEYEDIRDADDALFDTIIRIEIGPDGRQYYLDDGHGDIKVLSPDGEFLFALGGTGYGAGEWVSSTVFTVAPNSRVYIWDATDHRFHAFDSDGAFLHTVEHHGGYLYPESFVWLSNDEFIVGGLSMDLGYLGYFAHRMRIEESGERFMLRHVGSFLETPEFAPGLYLDVAGGLFARDIDGHLLFTARSVHSVEKYSLDGTPIWGLSDPEILPDVAGYLKTTPTGRVVLTRFANPATLLATDDRIVHVVFREPPNMPDALDRVDMREITIPKVLELIDRNDPQTQRLVVHTEADFWLRATDNEGRVYGVIDMLGKPRPVRGRFSVHSPK